MIVHIFLNPWRWETSLFRFEGNNRVFSSCQIYFFHNLCYIDTLVSYTCEPLLEDMQTLYYGVQSLLHDSKSNIIFLLIVGSDEGLYAWVIANYALGTLGSDPLQTTGIIELGGASAQVDLIILKNFNLSPYWGCFGLFYSRHSCHLKLMRTLLQFSVSRAKNSVRTCHFLLKGVSVIAFKLTENLIAQ